MGLFGGIGKAVTGGLGAVAKPAGAAAGAIGSMGKAPAAGAGGGVLGAIKAKVPSPIATAGPATAPGIGAGKSRKRFVSRGIGGRR